MKTADEVFDKYPMFRARLDPGLLQASLNHARSMVHKASLRLMEVIRQHGLNTSSLFVGHSGGKDSVVAHFVAMHALGKNLPLVHTTKLGTQRNAPHPATVQFLYNLTYEHHIVFRPLESEDHPSIPYMIQIDGTRMLEAERSDGRSTDLVFDGQTINRRDMKVFNPSGLFGLRFIYPIFDWTDHDVWATIFWFGLPFSEEYLVVDWVAES